MDKIEYGVFLDSERLAHKRGRPSKYAKTLREFLESGEPQAKIECANATAAHKKVCAFRMYIEPHNIPVSAHMNGSSVVLVKEG